jgi:hypothetical protein
MFFQSDISTVKHIGLIRKLFLSSQRTQFIFIRYWLILHGNNSYVLCEFCDNIYLAYSVSKTQRIPMLKLATHAGCYE